MKPWYRQMTFWTAIAAIVTAVGGLWSGALTEEQIDALVLSLVALSQIFLRRAVNETAGGK
ncbi:hypothetical protein HS125_04770 [bacterium]|nr:hypothetical protein [bacterium]